MLAEKIVTMVDRGDATTRDRDFADVFVLIGRHEIVAERLAAAVHATAAHRGSDLRPLRSVLVELAGLRQSDWDRFLARSGLDDAAPRSLGETIEAIADFVDPIITGEVSREVWDPARRRWRRRRGADAW